MIVAVFDRFGRFAVSVFGNGSFRGRRLGIGLEGMVGENCIVGGKSEGMKLDNILLEVTTPFTIFTLWLTTEPDETNPSPVTKTLGQIMIIN